MRKPTRQALGASRHLLPRTLHPVRPLMDAEWDERKAAHSELWVGMNGRRTVGQQRGLWSAEKGACNVTSAAPSSDQSVCYGWAEHNKPVVTPDFYLSTGLTVIIHLDQGVVNRMVWDSSCNLCAHGGSDEVSCEWDRSNTTCPGESGQCSDCYAHLLPGACGADATVCTPKIYVAWLGTDKHGQPLLSAGPSWTGPNVQPSALLLMLRLTGALNACPISPSLPPR